MTQNAKRNAVDSQFMLDSEVLKYWAEVFETGAKAIQSQETTMLSRHSWARPKNRRLYTLYSTLETVEIRDTARVGPNGPRLLVSSASEVEVSSDGLPSPLVS